MSQSRCQTISMFVINGLLLATGIAIFGLVIAIHNISIWMAMLYWYLALPYIISSVIGFLAGCGKNRVLMTVYVIFAVLGFLAAVGLTIAVIVVNHVLFDVHCYYSRTVCHCRPDTDFDRCVKDTDITHMFYAITALMVIGLVLALAGSIIGCVARGSTQSESQGMVINPNYIQGVPTVVYQTEPQMAHMPGAVYGGQVNVGYQPVVQQYGYPQPGEIAKF